MRQIIKIKLINGVTCYNRKPVEIPTTLRTLLLGQGEGSSLYMSRNKCKQLTLELNE